MYFEFENKKITGILSVLPEKTFYMEDEIEDPNNKKTIRLKKIIGYGARRRTKATTTVSDMLLFGLNKLIDSGRLKKEDIGAIVVVTLSQDHIIPTVSQIIQGELGLGTDVFCIDIPQACSGFTVGLIESFMLLDKIQDGRKVILCTGDNLNRCPFGAGRKLEHPNFGGDIANITVIENSDRAGRIFCSFFNDGSQREALIIRHGGLRSPMTPQMINRETSSLPFSKIDMDGSSVFNFVQKELPPAIEDICKRANISKEDVDWYLFHQPNRYMLEKLSAAMGVPEEKVPMNLTQELGNSNSGTIPAVITTYVSNEFMRQGLKKCILSGFGAGLTWSSIYMEIGDLDFCENIVSDL